MKSLALYGFASATREGIWQSKADEVWSIVWAYKYDIPRLDRILEIHPIWMMAQSKKPEFAKVRSHWEWLKTNVEIPVYMTHHRPDVPQCIRYPVEEVQKFIPEQRRKKVFSSSFDYLMGLAVLEGFQRIELYGFEMGSDTEYRYQREGAAYWIGYCDALGIEVVQPPNSALLRSKMYGFEGGSMIFRQDMERLKAERERQKVEAFAKLAFLEGKMKAAVDQGDTETQKDLASKWDEQYRTALVIAGALQECEYILKEIDLEEPDDELVDPFRIIEVD